MISTKGRYAVRVMVDLSEQPGETYVPLKDIAQRQEISQKYLEMIMRELVRGGFLKAASGRGGGYRLCRRPEEYSIGEILEFMEGSLAVVACLDKNAEPCPRRSVCKTLPMWEEYNSMSHEFFYEKTIADLL